MNLLAPLDERWKIEIIHVKESDAVIITPNTFTVYFKCMSDLAMLHHSSGTVPFHTTNTRVTDSLPLIPDTLEW